MKWSWTLTLVRLGRGGWWPKLEAGSESLAQPPAHARPPVRTSRVTLSATRQNIANGANLELLGISLPKGA